MSAPTYVTVVSPVESPRAEIETIDENYQIDENQQAAEPDPVVLVNINTANLEELMSLPGIGEVIGQRIIDYREDGGFFASKEELMLVSGIGEKVFENLRDLIVI